MNEQLGMAIKVVEGKVIIHLNQVVNAITLEPLEALVFATALISKAHSALQKEKSLIEIPKGRM